MNKIELIPGVVTEIPVDRIVPDANQPRKAFRAKPLEELAENIRHRGVLQPITVVPSGAHEFMIKTGERRWRASKLAGLKTVPALLNMVEGETADLAIDQLSENDLREGLSPIERAGVYQRLKDDGLGPQAISDLLATHGISVSRPEVSNTLRLLKLPEKARDGVASGTLKVSYARLLLPLVDWPAVVNNVVEALEADPPYDEEDARLTINSCVSDAGVRLEEADGCGKGCSCRVKTTAGWRGDEFYCMDPDRINAKRDERASAPAGDDQGDTQDAKPVEKDPTKVKPVKVKESKDGVVATSRRKYGSYSSLERVDFDTSDCQTCPHQHLASYNGSKTNANKTCFYTPCFENLARQQKKIENRGVRIRELIDDQLLKPLIETVARVPVSTEIVLALLAYVGAGYPVEEKPSADAGSYLETASPHDHYDSNARSTSAALRAIPSRIQRGTLSAFLGGGYLTKEIDQLVEAVVQSLNLEQRRELALYASMDIASFWSNSEEYAALFTKPEIVGLIGDKFDPPDVPAGEWRARLVDTAGVPDPVREIWNSPINNIVGRQDLEDDDVQERVA